MLPWCQATHPGKHPGPRRSESYAWNCFLSQAGLPGGKPNRPFMRVEKKAQGLVQVERRAPWGLGCTVGRWETC